ncbi:MAG TPA: RHS repeat-associated core domain-containing protein [Anaeromyxobacter sp.]
MNAKLVAAIVSVLTAQIGRPDDGLQIDESKGLPTYLYRFDLPRARGRFQPRLALRHVPVSYWKYNNADDEAGQGSGWFIDLPRIEGRSDGTFYWVEGMPYRSSDEVPLVALSATQRGGNGHFARKIETSYLDLTQPTTSTWEGRDGVGNVWTFQQIGTSLRWELASVTDPEGNETRYTWSGDAAPGLGWVLVRIDYNPYGSGQHATTISLEYLSGATTCGPTQTALKNIRIQGQGATGLVTTRRYELSITCGSSGYRFLDAISDIGQEAGPERLITSFGYQGFSLASFVTPSGARTDLGYTDGEAYGLVYTSMNPTWYPVLSSVTTNGPGVATSATYYWYSTPIVAADGEYRGFAQSWSQDDTTRIVKKTFWETGSHALIGWARKVERGAESNAGLVPTPSSAGVPPQYWSVMSTQSLWNGFRYLSSASCTMPSTFTDPAASEPTEYPVIPYTVIEQTAKPEGTSRRSVECSNVDAFGNFGKITIVRPTGTYVIQSTYEAGFDASASCKGCLRETWKSDPSGNRLEGTKYEYWTTFLPRTLRAQVDPAKPNADQWSVVQTWAYSTSGNVQATTDANGNTHSYTYGDGFDLNVTRDELSDGGDVKLVTEVAYDGFGRPAQLTGPYVMSSTFATAEDQKLRSYVAYDSVGRQRIVARLPIDGTNVRSAVQAFKYHDFDPANPSVLPSIDAFTFVVPRDYTDPEVPESSDVRRATVYLDGLGRQVQVRERLGGTGSSATGANITQDLTHYRVSVARVLDGAGRVVADVDPYFSANAQFVDLRTAPLDKLNAGDVVLATFRSFDPQGRVSCLTRRDFASGAPATGTCSSSFSSSGYALATKYTYSTANAGYLAIKTIPAENNVNGSTAGPESFYDAAGVLRWTADAEGNIERPQYDLIGRRTGTVREVVGNVKQPIASTVVLDMMGRVIKRIDPNGGTRRFEYEPSAPGLLSRVVFEKTNDELDYAYDKGRVKSVAQCSAASGTLTCSTSSSFQYDVPWKSGYTHTEGRIAAAWNGNTTIALAYDVNGSITRRDQWLPGFDQPFSSTGAAREDGALTQASFAAPGGLTYGFATSYDSAGRPVLVASGGTMHWSAPNVPANTGAYDAAGKLSSVQVDAGAVQQTWSYHPYSGLRSAESVSFTGGSAQAIYSVDSMAYQGTKLKGYRDVLNQAEHAFWYSDVGQLVGARTRPVGATTNAGLLCLGYSTTNKFGPGPSFGNVELTRDSGMTTDFAYAGTGIEATPQAGPDAVTGVGSMVVEYDVFGRLWRTAGGTETFGYDLLDRLTSITRAGGTSESLAYGPFGAVFSRQIGTALTYYIGPHATVKGTILASCASSPCGIDPSTMQADVHVMAGLQRIASVRIGSGASRTLYLHRDRLGSVVATTLGGGGTGANYRYSPSGTFDVAPVGDSGDTASEIGYAGGLRLSGGLLVMGARVYYPALRSFLQPDPLAPFAYTYVRGDPINRIDPTGLLDAGVPTKCEKDCSGGPGDAPPPPPPPPDPDPNAPRPEGGTEEIVVTAPTRPSQWNWAGDRIGAGSSVGRRVFIVEFKNQFGHNFMRLPRTAFAATTATVASGITVWHAYEATTLTTELLGGLTPMEAASGSWYMLTTPGTYLEIVGAPFAEGALCTVALGGSVLFFAYTYEVAFESAAEAWYSTTVDSIYTVLVNSQAGR